MHFTLKIINRLILLTILIIVLILGVTLYNMLALEEIEYPENRYVSSNIEMYFLPSEVSLTRIFEVINSSEDSISCVFRSLNYEKLELLLKTKEESGVKVRLFVNNEYMGNKRIYWPFVRFSNETEGMMHANYCIIDNKITLVGSAIFNENTLSLNFHDVFIINSTELATNFGKHFWYLYNNQTRTNSFNSSKITINNTNLTPLFCPADDCQGEYIRLIKNAEDKIYFASYAFTNPEIISAIKEAQERGVEIIGVVERQGLTPNSIAFEDIEGVVIDKFNRKIHTKVMVVDGEKIITGSLNPSITGVNSNDEAILSLENNELGKIYEEYIKYVSE